MSKPTDQLTGHDYDGIEEYDNPLPSWWVWMFIGTVIWAIAYVPYFHGGPGQLPREEWKDDMHAHFTAHPPVTLLAGDELANKLADPAVVSAGKAVFETRCAACHLADGGGVVGPNLTDLFSIHGASPDAMLQVVYEGVPDKGMISWKSQLKLDEVYAVTAYARSLIGTTPAKPKAPQGEPFSL